MVRLVWGPQHDSRAADKAIYASFQPIALGILLTHINQSRYGIDSTSAVKIAKHLDNYSLN